MKKRKKKNEDRFIKICFILIIGVIIIFYLSVITQKYDTKVNSKYNCELLRECIITNHICSNVTGTGSNTFSNWEIDRPANLVEQADYYMETCFKNMEEKCYAE